MEVQTITLESVKYLKFWWVLTKFITRIIQVFQVDSISIHEVQWQNGSNISEKIEKIIRSFIIDPQLIHETVRSDPFSFEVATISAKFYKLLALESF